MYFDFEKCKSIFSGMHNHSLFDEKERMKRKKKLFERMVFDTSNINELSDVSIDDMFEVLADVEGFCGEQFSFQKTIEAAVESVAKSKSIPRKRVL